MRRRRSGRLALRDKLKQCCRNAIFLLTHLIHANLEMKAEQLMKDKKSTPSHLLLGAFALILVAAQSQVVWGQAHFGDPHAGLAVHGAGEASELGQVAAKLYKSANDDLGKCCLLYTSRCV